MGKNLAIVGATGLVGRTMLKVLEERDFPAKSIKALASRKSAGQTLSFKNKEIKVEELKESSFENVEIALFSAGKAVSLKFAPIAAKSGAIVIDNSSAWRSDPEIPLVVPEVNREVLAGYRGIIANPNCSTIQMVAVLKPLRDAFGIKRVVVSTYQSISGAGQKGLDKLFDELKGGGLDYDSVAYNAIFHPIDPKTAYTEEELKMINETRKILGAPNFKITATCVRLPILGGHGESLNVEFEREVEVEEAKKILERAEGVTLFDDPESQKYPTPLFASEKDDIFVGRVRKDLSIPNAINLWIVADNLRKGAATNAVQIAELYA